jgi:hypothetical protein
LKSRCGDRGSNDYFTTDIRDMSQGKANGSLDDLKLPKFLQQVWRDGLGVGITATAAMP